MDLDEILLVVKTILITLTFVLVCFGINHCLKIINESDLEYCIRTKPMMNVTGRAYDERISKICYGDSWKEYCKYSYPMDCPKKKLFGVLQ